MTIPDSPAAHQHPNVTNVQETLGTADNVPETWLCCTLMHAADRHQVPLPDAIAATEQLLYRLGELVQAGTLPDPTHSLDRLRLFVAGFAAGAATAGGAQ